jgi:pimeloyl-ACP methyl ester carboxylesterase
MRRIIFYILSVAIVLNPLLWISLNSNPPFHMLPTNNYHMNDTFKLQVKVKGEGTPILLVPGGLTGWKSWEPFVEIFSSQNREVISVQLLSVEYGLENKQLPYNYSVKTESRALAATLDSLGYNSPMDIVAWSFGALTSLDFALDHPDRIRSLTLIEPPAFWVLRENGQLDTQSRNILNFFESLHGDITDEMLEVFLEGAGFVKPGESPRDLPQWPQWLPFKQSLRNCPSVAIHRDDLNRLQQLKSPVLLLKGTGSSLFFHKIIEGLDSGLPNSRVIELPGGHALHIVSRDRFLLELGNFQKSPATNKIDSHY